MKLPERLKKSSWIIMLGLVCYINLMTNMSYLIPDIMEARNLITAREMVLKDNWLSPTMNNYPRLAKPPLPTWLNAFLGQFYPVSNLGIHRIPSALAAVLMIFSIGGIAKIFDDRSGYSMIAGSMAATAFYLVFMGRQATWDIYCHAFMTTAIYFLVKAWYLNTSSWLNHVLAGLFMGLSFLSKGPVALYAMFLPFVISWTIFIDAKMWKKHGRYLVLGSLVFAVTGFSWPVYSYITKPDLFIHTMGAEVTAWSERHVRPFYQYWGFWGHIGVWAVFTLSTFFYMHMRRRMDRTLYHFLLCWMLLAVILLSIPAEKKERYLLPVLTPMVLLTAQYGTYLFRSSITHTLRYFDKIVLRTNSVIMTLVCMAIPVSFFLNGTPQNILEILFYTGLAVAFILTLRNQRVEIIFFAMILLMSSISIIILPKSEKFLVTNREYRSLSVLQNIPQYNLNFYGRDINPKQIYELGKSVDTLRISDKKIVLPEEENFIILTKSQITRQSFIAPVHQLHLLDSIAYDPDNYRSKYYVYELTSELQP